MSQSIWLENYSDKSFVIRGNVKDHKESLLNMGGKWVSCLTDKNTGEKFGSFVFWIGKKKDIEQWINKNFHSTENSDISPSSVHQNYEEHGEASNDRDIKRLEDKIDKLTNMLKDIYTHINCDKNIVYNKPQNAKISIVDVNSDIEDPDDDIPEKPIKKLLTRRFNTKQ